MVRQMIIDLEEGDINKKELESYKRDTGSYLELIRTYREEVDGYRGITAKKDQTIKELRLQLSIKEKEILVHKSATNSKFWKGLGIGTVSGGLLVLLVTLL